MDFLGIIPARYDSSRFPGKPLALLLDKPVIQWVYERAVSALDEVYVATDDERIFDAVNDFGGNVVMTSRKHQSGTDRCKEAMEIIMNGTGINIDVVLNIQGDEPFIQPEQIELLKSCFSDPETEIASLARLIDRNEDIFDENKPKVILDNNDFAIIFSRAPLPFLRGVDSANWIKHHNFFKHIGVYAYRKEVLREITEIPMSKLEIAESLEQLRWLENGKRIKIAISEIESIGIDTPEDLRKAVFQLKKDQ